MKKVLVVIATMFLLTIILSSENVSAWNGEIREELRYLNTVETDPDPIYSRGYNPAVTVLVNGLVVAIKDYQGKLSYQVGEEKDGVMYWTYPEEYDTGKNASITTWQSYQVMEIHEGESVFDSNVYYNLGRYTDNGSIDWYSVGNVYSTDAYHPTITALYGAQFVVSHQNLFNNLYNGVAFYDSVETRDIKWVQQGNRYDTGRTPSLTAITPEFESPWIVKTHVLEMHQSHANNGLWYRIANIPIKDGIEEWGPSVKFDNGHDPVAVQLNNGHILTMFEGASGNNPTWNRIGKVVDDKIEWTTNTYTEFNGTKNDVVQLGSAYVPNDFILNVRQSPDDNVLLYTLGKWNEGSKRIEWQN
ncbi:hypothetical protein [Jeotgalibacillus marinus]|uniref:Uncharacterized protein n=1 Tax=Jeotgalibacillus marinus TaxID=86667 RepID=A0ABV3Q4D9_9BACL